MNFLRKYQKTEDDLNTQVEMKDSNAQLPNQTYLHKGVKNIQMIQKNNYEMNDQQTEENNQLLYQQPQNYDPSIDENLNNVKTLIQIPSLQQNGYEISTPKNELKKTESGINNFFLKKAKDLSQKNLGILGISQKDLTNISNNQSKSQIIQLNITQDQTQRDQNKKSLKDIFQMVKQRYLVQSRFQENVKSLVKIRNQKSLNIHKTPTQQDIRKSRQTIKGNHTIMTKKYRDSQKIKDNNQGVFSNEKQVKPIENEKSYNKKISYLLNDNNQELQNYMEKLQLNDFQNKIDQEQMKKFVRFYLKNFKKFYKSKISNVLNDHEYSINQIRFSICGKKFASSSQGSLKIWSIENQKLIVSIDKPNLLFYSIAFTNDQQYIVCGCSDSSIKFWNLKNFIIEETLYVHQSKVNALSVQPNDNNLASASDDGIIQIVDLKTFNLKQSLYGHEGFIQCLFHTKDNKYLLSGGYDETIRIWELIGYQCIFNLMGHTDIISSIITKDNIIVSCSKDKTIKIWNFKEGQCQKTINNKDYSINDLALSSDCSTLLGACTDGSVKLWNMHDYQNDQTFIQHEGSVNTVCFSPDMKFFVTGSDDTQINIWIANTYQSSQQYLAIDLQIKRISFIQ